MYPKLVKEIRSQSGELHFKRWAFIETKLFNIYLHYIEMSDFDLYAHNHPWNFVSILLWGTYIEKLLTPFWSLNSGRWTFRDKMVVRKAPSVCYRSMEQFHQITLIKPTYTLVFTGPRQEEWGYATDSGYVESEEYRRLKNEKSKRQQVVDGQEN